MRVQVRRPDRSTAGDVTATQFTMVERFNRPGSWTLTTTEPADAEALMVRGSGIVVADDADTIVFSGPTRYMRGEYRGGVETWTFAGSDDLGLLSRVMAWPKPTEPVADQADKGDVVSGRVETLILDFIANNAVNRLGLPLTVPASLGRGRVRRARARWRNLAEMLEALATLDTGLGFRIVQDGQRRLAVQVYLGADRTHDALLSDYTGLTTEWDYTEEYPETTRVVVAIGDDPWERTYRLVRDTALESSWETRAETFIDERGINPVARTITSGVTGAAASNTITTEKDHDLRNGDEIRFSRMNGGKGLRLHRSYYVRDKTAKTFKLSDNPGLSGVEDLDKDITSAGIEVLDWPAAYAEADEKAQETLADASPVQSFRLRLAEGFVYGRDLRVGDLVSAYPAGVTVQDRISEATVTIGDEGETVEVWVGRKDPDPDERQEQIAGGFARRLRQLERSW